MVWAPENMFERHLPFMLVTGFLGSGKTTLLNSLLKDPQLANTAVAVNEFGEVPLDHELLETSVDDVVVLSNGCLCCFASNDIEDALVRLFERAQDPALPDFNRLIIETSGLADPEFVLHAILDSLIASRFLWLDSIVTTVDAIYGADQMEQHTEAANQIGLANTLVITKADMVDADHLAALQQKLKAANPVARQLVTSDPAFGTAALCSPTFLDTSRDTSLIGSWLENDPVLSNRPRPPRHAHAHADHKPSGPAHATDITSVALTSETPVDWRQFQLWFGAQLQRYRSNLLRAKGLVNATGTAKPVVVHAIQSTQHVPIELEHWPDGPHNTRLVFILRDTDPAEITAAWDAFLKDTGTRSPVPTEPVAIGP